MTLRARMYAFVCAGVVFVALAVAGGAARAQAAECPGYAGDPRPDIIGTAGPDDLNGTAVGEVICGLAGDDRINGGGGPDLIDTGTHSPNSTADAAYGEGGDDHLVGDNVPAYGTSAEHFGVEYLSGGPGDDVIEGRGGGESAEGGEGEDRMFTGEGFAWYEGGPDDDQIVGGAVVLTQLLRGNDGDDTILGEPQHQLSAQTAAREAGNRDTIEGGEGNDQLYGGPEPDLLTGGPGDDLMYGGPGSDDFREEGQGGLGSDTISGGEGMWDHTPLPNPQEFRLGFDYDTVYYWATFDPGHEIPAEATRITLDDVRDDGRPGELDLVGADIEGADTGPGDDLFVGNSDVNRAFMRSGDDVAIGNGGAREMFETGRGDDFIDVLDGDGPFEVAGDEFGAGIPLDAIDDAAICGGGVDRAVLDWNDVGGDSPDSTGAEGQGCEKGLETARARLRVAPSGWFSVPLSCAGRRAKSPCVGLIAVRRGKKGKVLSSRRYRVARGKRGKARLELNRPVGGRVTIVLEGNGRVVKGGRRYKAVLAK